MADFASPRKELMFISKIYIIGSDSTGCYYYKILIWNKCAEDLCSQAVNVFILFWRPFGLDLGIRFF